MAALVSQKQSKNIYIEFINNTKKVTLQYSKKVAAEI